MGFIGIQRHVRVIRGGVPEALLVASRERLDADEAAVQRGGEIDECGGGKRHPRIIATVIR